MYSCGHPGTFNPAVITNRGYIVYDNMNKDAGASHTAAGGKKSSSPKISKRGQPSFSG